MGLKSKFKKIPLEIFDSSKDATYLLSSDLKVLELKYKELFKF